MQILHPTGGYTCKVFQPFSRQWHANGTKAATTVMQNRDQHSCSGQMGSNGMQLAAKLQKHMQNLHELAAMTMQSCQ